MRILQVITGLSRAAGTSVFCADLSNELVSAGHDVTIAVNNPLAKDHCNLDPKVKVIAIPSILNPSTFCLSPFTFHLVHLHALWAPILHRVAKWARVNRVPIVWSPHGMITHWAMNNKRLKKLLGWYLYQKRDLQYATLLHATAESEVDDIRRMGLKNKIVIVPLGVGMEDREEVRGEKVKVKENGDERTLLFVSRVQRKKGLPNLIKAWSKLSPEVKKGWQVRIVGPDQDNHTAELEHLCDALNITWEDRSSRWPNHPGAHLLSGPDIIFVGPKFGNELVAEYDTADLFVLPTHSENFGAVVIESLAHDVPVICTKGAPWKELETARCGRWIDIGVEPLVVALTELMSLSDAARHEMGTRGRKLAGEKYSWSAICRKMVEGYEMLRKVAM